MGECTITTQVLVNHKESVMDYTILMGSSSADLAKKVNNWCKSGWEPHGSLVIHKTPTGVIFYQPVVMK